MRCIIIHTRRIQSLINHLPFFNNPLNCLLFVGPSPHVCCLLCCLLPLSLVYSILSSWISMELCIFPYQHRGGPRPSLAQKGLTVYSVGHNLFPQRGLSFHISSSLSVSVSCRVKLVAFSFHLFSSSPTSSGYNHLRVGD